MYIKRNGFLDINVSFLLVLTNSLINQCFGLNISTQNFKNETGTFQYYDIGACKRNEYYDFGYFACMDCNKENIYLQPSPDKFSCQCPQNFTLLYDIVKKQRKCVKVCDPLQTSTTEEHQQDAEICIQLLTKNATETVCKFLYVNFTSTIKKDSLQSAPTEVQISQINPSNDENCSVCNLVHNFRYKNFCIVNALIKPYLHYNSFSLATLTKSDFGDLKFVAFFCLALHNKTACNQLANLCVLAHFSLDHNSPCSSFLLTQASDVVLRYGSFDEHTYGNTPFLFYKKGKQVAKLLKDPISGTYFTLDSQSQQSKFQFYSISYDLSGLLQRWEKFKLNTVNLCNLHTSGLLYSEQQIQFGKRYVISECKLNLESIIDLAKIYNNNNFISIFLKTTSKSNEKLISMHQLPILIDDLSTDNQRDHIEEWQLVKRFLIIESQPKINLGRLIAPAYTDAHKLALYRSIRYVEHFEIHYKIHDGNSVTLPLVKLRYKQIELNANSTLDEIFSFKLQINFERLNEGSRRQLIYEVILPIFFVLAIAIAFMRALNVKRRRGSIDFCEFSCFTEFLLNLSSNLANVLLMSFLLYVTWLAMEFFTQNTVKLTLPLIKEGDDSLKILIYSALVLKLLFLGTHLWRISSLDLFFMDWERPKSSENNHFNIKNNLETSSVCSSVRTFVAENNVSAWRTFFTANEWIRLCVKQRTSTIFQGFSILIIFKVLSQNNENYDDLILQLFEIIVPYFLLYWTQLICREYIFNRVFNNPIRKFVDLCSLANISVLTLVEPSYGYYIHGRSPHGFADTDMSSMITQLQRESQSMCARRGLLSDSDHQTYIVLPPKNLRSYFERLLIPFQRSTMQTQYQKGVSTIECNLERTSVAYSSINRFFCAFIDHSIKDMDYIVKEQTFLEQLLDFEFDNNLADNKGTFYADKSYTMGKLFLYGNDLDIFVVQLTLLLSIFLITSSISIAIITICVFNVILQNIFKSCVRRNLSAKTLIDKRFLI